MKSKSGRRQSLKGLTRDQQSTLSNADNGFDRGWNAARDILTDEDELQGNIGKAWRRQLEKRVRARGYEITPAPKQAAIDRKRKLTTVIWRYLRRFGQPSNIAQFRERLRCKGMLKVAYKGGELFDLDEKTFERIMQRLGVAGKPGRKPKQP